MLRRFGRVWVAECSGVTSRGPRGKTPVSRRIDYSASYEGIDYKVCLHTTQADIQSRQGDRPSIGSTIMATYIQ